MTDPALVSGLAETSSPGAPPVASLDGQGRVRLMRESLVNYLPLLVSGLVGIVLVPLMLQGLGADAYGLWIATLAVGGVVGLMNPGLGWSVTREVAAARGQASEDTVRLVSSVASLTLLLSLAGGTLIAVVGLGLAGALQLSPETRQVAPAVFGLAGLAFWANEMLSFTLCILHGLRRFGTASGITVGFSLVRAAGIVALLVSGAGLLAIAGWQALTSVAAVVLTIAIVPRLKPGWHVRLGRIHWRMVRAQLPFGIGSQLTTAAAELVWHSQPVLIGLLRGSAAIVPYHIGQKFPAAVLGVSWRTSEVLFPAASEAPGADDAVHTRDLLLAGLRWNLVLVLPLFAVLWIVAPILLRAWLPEVPPGTILVVRLASAAVLAEAVTLGPLYVLWGRGAIRPLLLVLGSTTLACLVVNAWLVAYSGVVALAAGLASVLAIRALLLLVIAARRCRIRSARLFSEATQGLLLPVAVCAVTAAGLVHFVRLPGWPGVVGTAAAAGLAYVVVLYFHGAREEERVLVRQLLFLPAALASFLWVALRRSSRQTDSSRD